MNSRTWLRTIASVLILLTMPSHAATILQLEQDELRFGFIKLTDMAPLAVAYELGYFEDESLYLTLEPQANLLDRVITGELDGAHSAAGLDAQIRVVRCGYFGDGHG